MVYVRDASSEALAAHMRSLKKMATWHDPMADRLWREVEELKAENASLKTGYAAYEKENAELKAEVEALRKDWQSECLKKGFEYVREPDDHYVIADTSEMVSLLRDLLGVDVRRKNGHDYGTSVKELEEQVEGLVNTLHDREDKLQKTIEALRKDADRYRFVSQLAWYVDRASYVYNIGNAQSPWSDQCASIDADDVEEAIDDAMSQSKTI